MSLTVVISPHRYTVGMMNYQEATRPINDRFYAEGTHLIKERNIFLSRNMIVLQRYKKDM